MAVNDRFYEQQKVARRTQLPITRDYTKASFDDMVLDVEGMWQELKRRNPVGVNVYRIDFEHCAMALRDIAEAERENPTCEAGPGVDK